jgi:hypothetical protein
VGNGPPAIDWDYVHPKNLAPLPAWLLDALLKKGARAKPAGDDTPDTVIRQGKRDVTLTSMAGFMRQAGFSEGAILSALLLENEARCIPSLPADQVEKIAHSVARYDPDPYAHVTFRGVTPAGRPHANGEAAPATDPQTVEILRVPASALRRMEKADQWLWEGYIARQSAVLLSAYWKCGKTTLLAHLLRALGSGEEDFCGQPVAGARVVYVTEEHEGLWAGRRDAVGFGDWCEFVVRPFLQKPNNSQWLAFIVALSESLERRPADLVVFDPLVNLWPVREENSASEVQAALMPLRLLNDKNNAAVCLVHHLRKGDGLEATGSRGSGALSGWADTLIELRRYAPTDKKDRRRVLTAYGRYEDTADEADTVIELGEHGYTAHGTKGDSVVRDVLQTIRGLLPASPPGLTQKAILDVWPDERRPRTQRFTDALRHGEEVHLWARLGTGHKGDPFTYYAPPADSIPFPSY